MKKKIGELLLQIIPVMVGVYLGFVISNWSDKKKIESQTQLFKTNIIAEIKSNESRVANIIAYHNIVRDSSQYYKSIKELNKIPRFFSGVRIPTLTNSTFETGVQTGLVNNLAFEDIQAINYVYTIQKSYNEFNTLLLSGLITSDFEENEKGLKKLYKYLSISMTDVVIKENQLINQYNKLLQQLN